MAGESTKRNQNFYCQYHQGYGHTTEDCRNLWNYLDQLVREGKLKHLLHILVVIKAKPVRNPRETLP